MMVVQTRTTKRIPVLLRKIYKDLKNPAIFSSPYRLYAKAKKINSKIKLQDVTDWLETQKSYTTELKPSSEGGRF